MGLTPRRITKLIIGFVFPPGVFTIAYPVISSIDWDNHPNFLYIKTLAYTFLILFWVADWIGTVFFVVKWARETSSTSP